MSYFDPDEADLQDQRAIARAYVHKARLLRDEVRGLRSKVSEPVTLVNLIAAGHHLDEAIIALKIAAGERLS